MGILCRQDVEKWHLNIYSNINFLPSQAYMWFHSSYPTANDFSIPQSQSISGQPCPLKIKLIVSNCFLKSIVPQQHMSILPGFMFFFLISSSFDQQYPVLIGFPPVYHAFLHFPYIFPALSTKWSDVSIIYGKEDQRHFRFIKRLSSTALSLHEVKPALFSAPDMIASQKKRL